MGIVLEVVKTTNKLAEHKENGEMLTLYRLYRLYRMTLYYICFYKIIKIGIPQYFCNPQKRGVAHKDLQAVAPTFEQTFVNPVNTGQTFVH